MTATQGPRQSTERSSRNGSAVSRDGAMRVGFITPWNQVCGLATYAKFFIPHFTKTEAIIFAESRCSTVGCDEGNVIRCWQRVGTGPQAHDYTALEAEIERANIDLLYVNCQASFFSQPHFSPLLRRCQKSGIKIVVHLHQLFTIVPETRALIEVADKVIVHAPANKLEAIANGAFPTNVIVVPHGVEIREEWAGETKESLRAKLGLQTAGPLVTSFGFIQPHKGMEAVIEAVAHLRARGIPARGLIIGESRIDQPQSADYLRALQQYAAKHNVSDSVAFISRFIPDAEVGEYLAASDLVVMNYQSRYFEASGACSLAVGSGAVVLSSLAPALMSFGDAVWHMTAGYPPGLAAELLLTNRDLYEQVRANARAYAASHAWPRIASTLESVCASLVSSQDARSVNRSSSKSLRVLVQNRPSTFSHRGGDTVVVEQLSAGLRARGVDVVVDVDGREDAAGYDLVHLFNFATPQLTESLAKRAHAAGVPFVVTTLYEDIPTFHHQSHAVALHLMEYVARGQDKRWWDATIVDLNEVAPAERFPVDWIARNASMLFTNGGGETAAIERDFPHVAPVVEVPVGHEVGAIVGPELFEREYGVKDFVLCVGRIETRKNQLLLLKALEDSELTVVLVGGGVSYQPDYEAAVRSFMRKGRTIVLDRISPEMLSSAYAACRVHALPSWYELPGLVSLEAAAHGKNIVVTRTGTTADYVGAKAFYCQPWDPDSINAAITAAFYAPVKEGLVEMAKSFTWERSVDTTAKAYEDVVRRSSVEGVSEPQSTPVGGCYDMSVETKDLESLVEQGERAAREGEYDRAESILRQVEAIDPTSERAMKARGAVCLAQGRIDEAKELFSRALSTTPLDPSLLTGLGMCHSLAGQPHEAVALFERALACAPDHLVALHQILENAYQSGAFNRAESALRRYLSVKPGDCEIRFCLAGVLYKQGLMAAASAELTRVLTERPGHDGARQLQEMISQAMNPTQTVAPTATTSSSSDSITDGMMDEVESLKRDCKVAQAREIFERVRQSGELTDSQLERFACIEAEFLVLDGKLKEAEDIYDQVLTANDQNPRALCGKGALAAERQEWMTAKSYFERARSIRASYDVALAGLGLCAMVSQSQEEAFELFTQAVSQNPENRRALLGVLQLGYPLKKYAEIEKALNSYLEIHPANIDMLYSFAGVLFTQGKVEQAKSQVEKILVFEPKHTLALELRDIIRGEKPVQSVVM